MKYRIYTKKLYYEIELNGKYTILCGDSGRRKSVLYSRILDRNAGDRSVHVEMLSDGGIWKTSTVSFFAVAANDARLEYHKEPDGAVFVVDENASVFQQNDAGTIFKESPHQFLLITRKNLDYLPVSVENIFHLRNEGKKHFFERMYSIKYTRVFGLQDIVITEDSGSGYKIFKEFFDNLQIQSAYSKTNIVNEIRNLPASIKNVLVVYDAAAFGMQIKKFNEFVLEENRNISVLDWYSFEHHVLSLKPFSTMIDPASLDYTHESMEQFATETLSKMIKYSGQQKAIRPCLVKHSMCSTCDRVGDCRYVHDAFDIDIFIANAAKGLKKVNVFSAGMVER